MNDFIASFSLEKYFGLEIDVIDNEILELSVVVKWTLNGYPMEYRSVIYEKPWEDYLTQEELKEFTETDLS